MYGTIVRMINSWASKLAMNIRYHFILVLVAGFALASFAAEPTTKIRLEMWEGCLCVGPTHSRTYDQVKDERAERMAFGTDVTLTHHEAELAPLALLRQKLGESKLKDKVAFYWKGVVYRRVGDGRSYAVHFRGAIRKFSLSDAKDGDLIVFFSESY